MAICRECHHRMCMYSCHRGLAIRVLITLSAVRIQEVKFLQISQAASKQTAFRFKHATADVTPLPSSSIKSSRTEEGLCYD